MALVGWWKLNGNTNDSSIYKNNGTNNGATLVDGGPLGKCYDFSNGYLSCGHISNNICIHENLTISFWVYTNNLPSSGTRRGIMQTAYGAEFAINITDNGSIQYYYGTSGSQTSPYSSTTCNNIFNVGEWHHITITVNVDTLKWTIYKDGNYITQSNMSYNPVAATSMALEIGRSYTGNFPGKLCNVRIYNHVLSTKEIKELAKCKVLHYTFNQFQEPTTNYVPAVVRQHTGGVSGFFSGIINPNNTEKGFKSFKVTTLNDSYYNGFIASGHTSSIPIGEVWSYSLDIWVPSGYNVMTRMRATTGGEYQGDTAVTVVGSSQWVHVEKTFTAGSNVSGSIEGVQSSGTVTDVFSFWVKNLQLEKKDHATPFVDGSRTGKVYDCSGYNNNADLTEDTTPKWVEGGPVGSGCYEFKQNQKIEINNILTNAFTISFWMKSVSDKVKHVIGNANGFFANGGGWFIGSASSAADMYFEVQDASSRTPIRFYSNRIYDWSHFIAIYDNGAMKTYLNGELKSSGSKIMGNVTNNIILGDKNISSYFMDGDLITDIRFYSTALSENDIRELYQARVSVDKDKSIYCNEIKEDKYVKPILDYSTWTVGTSGSQPGFNINGSSTENYIIESSDPFGNIIPIWEARPDATSGADGGWNTTPYFSVDNSKYYRFSVWVKRTVKGNGHFYLGLNGYNSLNENIGVLTRSTGSVNTNPYFQINSNWTEWESGLTHKWYLVVAHVFPVGSGTGSNHPESGVYDINGNKVKDAENDFVWQSDVVKSRHRSYLYYSTDTSTRQQWCYPRVDMCDGSEPTIADLLNGIDYEHYKILKGEESSGSIRKTGLIKVNEVNSIGPTNGLVHYMPLNGDTKDYSGNKNDGINNGATIVQGLGNKLAYEFDGSSYIYNSNVFLDSDPVFTVCGWFKRTGNWSSNSLWGLGTNGNAISTYQSNSESQTGFDKYNSTTYYASATINLNEWHFITWIKNAKGTFNSSILYIYVDGILTTLTQQRNNNTTANVTSGFTLGRVAYDQSLYGSKSCMQDIRIYDRALSPQEIFWLYDMYNPNKNIGAKIFKNNILYAHSFKEGY